MPDPEPDDDDPDGPAQPSDDRRTARPTAEVIRYRRRAAERPGEVREERDRIVELLSAGRSTGLDQLKQRAAASAALATLAQDDPGSLEAVLPELVGELRRETDRKRSDAALEHRVISRTVSTRLVRTIARIVVASPHPPFGRDAVADFVGAVTTDLDTTSIRVATNAVFVCADDHPGALASAAELLGELLGFPDAVVQAWSAATVGRVAAEHPDAMAATAASLRRLLTHDDGTVRHNALEALAALVGPRPDVVAPAAAELRGLLDHDDVAIQHNAAGVLGHLAGEYPDAVLPAADALRELSDHDDVAVRRVATHALARLATRRPEAIADR